MPLRVVWKNLLRHPVRSILTAGSLAVAIFLMAVLHSFLRALDSSVEESRDDRVIVQSAVSLFVELPVSYQQKIESVEGVLESCKWNWFGGYYQDPRNFFAQFACDPDTLLEVYSEIQIVDGSFEDFRSRRTACLVGKGLVDNPAYDFQVGERVPIISNIFQRADREPWTFDVAAVYVPTKPTVDNTTLFFHFDYLEEALDGGLASGPRGTSTYSLKLEPGADPVAVMSAIDAIYENGPQKTETVPQSVFNAQFVSMWGNVPVFVSAIGLAVFAAVLVACINTMLMAARQQTHDIGIMKALGFTDGAMSATLFAQSIVLSLLGGGAGLALASSLPLLVADTNMQAFFPQVGLRSETLLLGGCATLLVGFLSGLIPAWSALRLTPVAALRSED